MKNNDYDGWAIASMITVVFLVLVFAPALCFLFGYIGGWFAKITIGEILCKGLNTLFGVAMFTPNQIPLIAGTLAWIGSFFKGASNVAKKD